MRPLCRSLCLAFVGALSLAACAAEGAPRAALESVAGTAKAPPVIGKTFAAGDVLRACRAMLPVRPIQISGALILRNRRGIVQSEHDYRLVMRRSPDVSLLTIHLSAKGATNELANVTISRRPGQPADIRFTKAGEKEPARIQTLLGTVLETDVTWLDLTFDFLWWKNAAYEEAREGESVHGQVCSVILVKPDTPIEGLSAVRLWVDKKTGCLMQAEQVDANGKSLRRLWGTRIKKFDGKWMVSVLEVETLGTRHRTKITIDDMKDL